MDVEALRLERYSSPLASRLIPVSRYHSGGVIRRLWPVVSYPLPQWR